ncbi:MAG TPA: GNAT family N-acetyltransferase [Candidatus Eisenbacteria bacterium]|nr:GNAT family N-acetyltransferase [Candidatus Eisenbacteria bacterium]
MSGRSPGAGDSGIVRLSGERAPEAVRVLCDAFGNYPVMRYMIGAPGARYADFLERLIAIFVSGRVLRDDPILAIEEAGRVVAIATTTRPGGPPTHPDVEAARDALLKELDPEAKARSEARVAVWRRTALDVPQYHVNMLGVLGTHAGRGLGGRLLREVHEMSRLDPGSTGVSLTTEDPRNVPLYRHCGYEIVSHDRVRHDLETWGFFRRDDVTEASR